MANFDTNSDTSISVQPNAMSITFDGSLFIVPPKE